MPPFLLLIVVLAVLSGVYVLGRRRALMASDQQPHLLHSRPNYHGWYVLIWCGIPALMILFFWWMFEELIVTHLIISGLPEDIRSLSSGKLNLFVADLRNSVIGGITSGTNSELVLVAAERYRNFLTISHAALSVVVATALVLGSSLAIRWINLEYRARNKVERVLKVFLIACSTLAIFTTVGIVLSVLFESIRFFALVSPWDFLFGLEWSPQTAIRKDQVGSSGAFGAIPVFAGTLLITLIAMLVAVPLGLFSAIYLAEYAGARLRTTAKPILEILAGIPTVVYGFFAALTVAPFIRNFGESFGLDVSSESALAAGLVMGVMIIPFVSSLSDDVINAVPQSMRDGSYGLGATRSETIRRVILPAALPGIVGSVLLAVSRAIGETMIVVMAAGLAANLTANPLEAVTTVTVQIVTLLVGDQEFDSAKTLAAFALGLFLFLVTLGLNIIALRVVRKYREQYE